MIEQCPHCSSGLRFSEAHREKLTTALASLPEGRSLKFACPKCKGAIELDKSGQPAGQAAAPAQQPSPSAMPVHPPKAPDISWLDGGEHVEEEGLEDIPSAMVLVDEPGLAQAVAKGLEEYQVVVPRNSRDAMDSMRFKTFDVVVLYSGYEKASLADQEFHRFMMKMGMKKRRRMFYVLVGPEFETLYDLQALSHSANLVVNASQVHHFATLVKKGLNDYEALFGPYLTALKHHGKD